MPAISRRLRKILAVNLRSARKERNLSQQAFSALAGLNPTYVGSIERGERNIAIDNIERLAAALKIDPRELLKPPETYMLKRLGKRK